MSYPLLPFNHRTLPLMNELLFINAFKESRHLIRHIELHLSLDCFPEKYTEKEAAPARADTLKRPPGRKRGGGRKKELEITSADFSADENDNENGLIGTEEEGDTSSDTFDEM